jgi:hypothetical protein
LKNVVKPLRTELGRPIPIRKADVIATSDEAANFRIFARTHAGYGEVVGADLYDELLPEVVRIGSTELTAPPGLAAMAMPEHFPFDATAPLMSAFALGDVVDEDISRKLWAEFEILFDVEAPVTVGGILFGGYPYVPYYVTEDGENSANFTLPREILLAWKTDRNIGFLDGDTGVLRQQPTSHGGFHVICTEPILTDRLILRLADFPRLIRRLREVESSVQVTERWACAIPYLYAFTYHEGVRYRPHVPAGLLAAMQSPPNFTFSHFSPVIGADNADETRRFAGGCCDLVRPTTFGGNYFHMSAASLTGAGRTYSVDMSGGAPQQLTELFASNPLNKGDEVVIYLEQGEEHDRCLAGLALFPHVTPIPGGSQPYPGRIRIRVYEIDPLDGVSPIRRTVRPYEDRYSSLLCDLEEGPAARLSCRFARITSTRYLAIVLTCLSDGGIIALDRIELIQSSRVAVTTRVSRNRRVHAMHYRIIGPELASDYAKLGDRGFSFAVEVHVDGQRKDVLYQANSLLDLLQVGSARLLGNHRRLEPVREISRETATTDVGSWERRHVDTSSFGWRQSETGDGVRWPAGRPYPPPAGQGFRVFGTQETRTHTEHIGHRGVEGYWEDVADFYRELGQLTDLDTSGIVPAPPADNRLTRTSATWEPRVWGGMVVPTVEGLFNLTVPPVWLAPEMVTDAFEAAKAIAQAFQGDLSNLSDADLNTLLNGLFASAWMLNGLSPSISVTPVGVGVGISVHAVMPTMNRSSTTGSIGTIAKQGNRVGYSYARYLDRNYQGSGVYTEYSGEKDGIGGEIRRTLIREPNQPGTEMQRRKGAEVVWQDQRQDIVIGSIPLGISLPAIASRLYSTSDIAVMVRFGGGMGGETLMDVWFDVDEEVIRDDY